MNIIKLENKAQILQKGKLAKPITTEFINYTEKVSGINTKDTEIAIVWGLYSVVAIPVAIVALPFALVSYLFTDSSK